MIAKILFWISVGLIGYSYLVYPIIINLISLLYKNRSVIQKWSEYPLVSILMSVYNEEESISEKLHSLNSLNYPAERLEIIVGSDSSTDNTNSLLKELEKRYSNLSVEYFNTRSGKPSVINRLVSKSKGEIIVITDVNVIPDRESLSLLVSRFVDIRVGLVDSVIIKKPKTDTRLSSPELAYQKYETWIKTAESSPGGCMMGPSGGYYAVRKELYTPVPHNFIVDDFFICMNILRKGYFSIIEPEAIATESETGSSKEEFRRQVRISSGNFQNLFEFIDLLLKPWTKTFYTFLSHKVIRWLTPFIYMVTLVTNFFLLEESKLYEVLFYVQLIFLLLPAIDTVLRFRKIHLFPIRFITHFYFMNLSLLAGLIKYITGIKNGTWEPTKRN